jgi:Tfp pilus assembly protein PilN
MRTPWQLLALALLAITLGVVLALQRQANGELRTVIGLLREQNHEVDRLQAERSHLITAQVSAAELDKLRADHAALARLRGEMEAARARIIEMERAESAAAPRN